MTRPQQTFRLQAISEARSRASAALRDGRLDDAAALLTRLLSLAGEDRVRAEAHTGLALVARRRGRAEDALAHYGRASALAPALVTAAMNLGAALGDAGRLAEAAQAFVRAAALQPDAADVRRAQAVALNRLGRSGEAEAAARAGLRGTPHDPALLKALAAALQAQDRPDEAVCALEAALAATPGDLDALYNLGAALKADGRSEAAVAAWTRLLERAPDHAPARLARVMAELRPFYADEAELAAARTAYARELEALAVWADAAPGGALAQAAGLSQPFDLPYQGGPPSGDPSSDVELQQTYGRIVARAVAASAPPAPLSPPPASRPTSGERIRIGIVSGFFRRHANWRMPVRGWVEGLDRSRFQLFGYHAGAQTDAETAHAAALFEGWVQGPLPPDAWRARIAADRPHVLIYPEIGMDAVCARLAAERLAPLQATSWGHPVTSGLPTLDLYLSSDLMEPPDAEGHYTERLVRLPGLSTPVRPEPRPARARRGPLGWPEAAMVFWCGQSPYKCLPRHDALFARIAAGVPAARIVFAAYPGSPRLTERFRMRLRRALADHGADPDACLILPRLPADDYLAAMGAADVVLDSLGWSGCNSLLDALAWRLPVVTLEGEVMRARHGAALLRALGLADAISRTAEDYVARAVALGRSAEARRAWAARLPADLAVELADPASVRALERVLIEALGMLA